MALLSRPRWELVGWTIPVRPVLALSLRRNLPLSTFLPRKIVNYWSLWGEFSRGRETERERERQQCLSGPHLVNDSATVRGVVHGRGRPIKRAKDLYHPGNVLFARFVSHSAVGGVCARRVSTCGYVAHGHGRWSRLNRRINYLWGVFHSFIKARREIIMTW